MNFLAVINEVEAQVPKRFKPYLSVLLASTKDYKKLVKWIERINQEGVSCLPTKGRAAKDPLVKALKTVTLMQVLGIEPGKIPSDLLWTEFQIAKKQLEDL